MLSPASQRQPGVTPDQAKAARHLLGWSRERLGGKSGITAHIIRVYETTGRRVTPPPWRLDPVPGMRTALEAAGVVFTNLGTSGVILQKSDDRHPIEA